MKKTLFLQFLLLFFIIISCKENRLENPPISQKGTIDLNNWSFEKNGAVNLKGEWEFYPGEFRNFSENQTKNEIPIIPKFIQVPSSWTESGYPMHGYATYRLKILLPKSKEKLAIFLAPIGTAYNFFANEKLLYQNGKPGVNKNSTEPLLKRKIISLPEEDKIDLIIQVSNFRFIKSGIFNEIKIDKEESLLSDQSWKISFDLVTFSAIFIFGIYHLVLFFFRKKDIIPLIFGIYCLIHSSRTLVMNDRWILDVFKELEFLLIIKVEFILSYLSSFFFAYYTYLFFPREFSRKMLKFLFLTLVGPAIFVLFTPFGIYSYTIFLTRYVIIILIIYIFYVLVLAVKRKRFASNLFFIGYFFYFSIAITGILKLFNLTHTPFWGNYGLLIFFIFQALIISNKFSLSFQTVENLSKELKIKSDNLEKTTIELRKLMLNLEEIVEERTGDLEKTKKELEFINKFSKLINSTNNLELVFEEAVKSINSSIEADVFLLQLLNSEKKELQYRCAHFPDEIDKELVKDYYSLKLPIDDGVGSYFVTISRKRTLYLKDLTRVSGEDFSEFDKKLIDDLKLNSVLQIPLIVKKEVIGIIHINKFGGLKTLNKKEIRFIEDLCEQIAVAVNNSALYEETERERQKAETLLLNILPDEVAMELKEKGVSEPTLFENVSVLFTDFKGFTKIAESLTPNELVKELDQCFSYFDSLMDRFNLEKLKTIGDSYMCAGGIPRRNKTHALDCVLAALEIQSVMNQMKELKELSGKPYWELRLGIHSGPLVAGVIGEKKFAYDVWGDTVNTASRMESSGTPGMINISGTTYELVKDLFDCEYRGKVNAKNKGEVDMYYVHGIKSEYSAHSDKKTPNEIFWKEYGKIS